MRRRWRRWLRRQLFSLLEQDRDTLADLMGEELDRRHRETLEAAARAAANWGDTRLAARLRAQAPISDAQLIRIVEPAIECTGTTGEQLRAILWERFAVPRLSALPRADADDLVRVLGDAWRERAA